MNKQDTRSGITPWAYAGTDAGATQYPLTPYNSLPALVVWLTMAVSTDLQNNMSAADIQNLANAIGLTANSVNGIRELLQNGSANVSGKTVNFSDAFAAVAQAFLQIGKLRSGPPYLPAVCPGLSDILSFAPAAAARVPQSS